LFSSSAQVACSAFYYSGFAQGVLLDYLMPGWKERALQGESLEELLAESIKK